MLITVIFVSLFGLTVLQSSALRRLVGIVQVIVMFVILTAFGSLVLPHAIAGVFGAIFGTFIGTKIAIKKGKKFAKYMLTLLAITTSLALIFTLIK